MSKGCRRCVTSTSAILSAEAEVRRLARQMSRPTITPERLSLLKDHLAIAKANLTKVAADADHECDTRLIDEHWMKAQK